LQPSARTGKAAHPAPLPPAKKVAATKPAAAKPPPARPKRTAPLPPPPAARKKPPKQPPRRPSQPADTPGSEAAEETCVIVWRREGTRSDFYAVATGGDRGEYVVASSPGFDWFGGDLPPEAWKAHARLVATLAEGGWRFVGTEGAWYRRRFERPAGGFPTVVPEEGLLSGRNAQPA
jgi:hypothetical protein